MKSTTHAPVRIKSLRITVAQIWQPIGRRRALRIGFLGLALGAFGLAPAAQPQAQAWPQKPIRLLVLAGPGSAPDQIARIISDRLGRTLGQPVIVENRVGANGLLGINQLKQAAPDGYTLTLVQAAAATVTPLVYKNANFDIVRDFEVIGTVGASPMLYVSNIDFPAKTLAEAIAIAKSAPGKVAMGSSSRGSIPNLANELLAAKSGASFQIVPFATSGQGVQAVIGGQVQMFVDGVGPVIQLIKSGRLRALASASETVLPGLEGIPLAKDTVPGLNVYGWFAMIAPKGTPKTILTRLNREINDTVSAPDVIEKFRAVGTYPRAGTVESAQQFIKSEIALWGGLIKATGVKPE